MFIGVGRNIGHDLMCKRITLEAEVLMYSKLPRHPLLGLIIVADALVARYVLSRTEFEVLVTSLLN